MKKYSRNSVVVACGTFDLLHLGHVHYLENAKKCGDFLVVIVARDENVKKIKGFYPVQDEKTRGRMVQSLKCVGKAVMGSKRNIFDKVKELNPDVLALGYDQRPTNEAIRKELSIRNCFPKIIRVSAFKANQHKSSILRRRVVENHHQNTSTWSVRKH